MLLLPSFHSGTVIVASGGDTARLDSPPGFIAQQLARGGFAALLMDFIVPSFGGVEEDLSRFDTGLLAARTIVTLDWTRRQAELCDEPVGCIGFGGAGSGVILAAAERSATIAAVVAVDPRLKFAEPVVASLPTPLLLLTHRRNQEATSESQQALLGTEARHHAIRTIPGRGETTSRRRLHEISSIASNWYARHFRRR